MVKKSGREWAHDHNDQIEASLLGEKGFASVE